MYPSGRGFFEWRATKGGKQPYAIALKDGSPFGIAGLWENWKDPASGEWIRTFAVITVPANQLVGQMPAAFLFKFCPPDKANHSLKFPATLGITLLGMFQVSLALVLK